MKVPHKDQQDTFKESRKSIAGAHVPLKQIGPGGNNRAYSRGWDRIFGKKQQLELNLEKETKK